MNDQPYTPTTPDRIEPMVAVDVDAMLAKLREEITANMEKAFEYAATSMREVQEHIEKHGLHFHDPYWVDISDLAEVNLSAENLEQAFHGAATSKFRDEFALLNPLEHAAAAYEATSRGIEKLQEEHGPETRVVTQAQIGGPDGERIINEIAAEHGHDTPEEECETIVGLRNLRKHLLTEHPDKYPSDPPAENPENPTPEA